MLNKYIGAFKIGLQENLQYRFNFFTTFIFIIAPLLVHLFLWTAVYGSGVGPKQMAGYTFSMMMTYTILGHLIDKFTNEVNHQLQVSAEIRDGVINRYILKPMDHLMFETAIVLSHRVIYFVVLILPYLGIIFLARKIFLFNANPLMILFFCINIFIGILLGFLVNHLVALSTFWLKEVTSLYVFTQSTFLFLSGGYFTLDFLPAGAYNILMMTPLPYMLFFPVKIFLGSLSYTDIWRGMLISITWIMLLILINKTVWDLGLRGHNADGL